MSIKTFVLIIFLSFSIIYGQTISDQLLESLNLDYPGLEEVRTNFLAGNLKDTRSSLLKYFQNRTNRRFEPKESEASQHKANLNAQNILNIKSIYHDFGEEVDWTMKQHDKEWQFTLNKMKWFMNFVAVYKESGDENYVKAWMDQVDSWIKMGDPGYPRTIDSGRRMEHWVISYLMFVSHLKSPSVTPEFNARMLLSMTQQAEYLYNPDHWRRYSNWGTFENSGFSKFVLMFPEFKRSEQWLKEIYFRMRFQLENSFYPDGMHIEVSPSYHSHEMSVWFDFLHLAELNNVKNPWSPQNFLVPLQDLIVRQASALMHWYKPTGFMPQVGDTDHSDEREILLKIGSKWNRPDLIYAATNGENGEPPDETSVAFPQGGYYILRSGWGNEQRSFSDELYLLFDCGLNKPWHAHYDMLNIVMTAYCHDLLKDPGRFTYNEDDERKYFKSTAAHNTIVIDGQDQSRSYIPQKAEWHSLSGLDYVIGQQNSDPEVNHQRSILFVKPAYWIVIDRLTGTGEHTYDQYWHLSDRALGKVYLKNDAQEVNSPNLKLFLNGENDKVDIENGYLSYSYRKKVEAPVICRSANGNLPVIWSTVLYPYQEKEPEITVKNIEVACTTENVNSTHPIAIRISSPSEEGHYLEQASPGNICAFGDFETDARMVFVSFDKEENLISLQMVDGSFLKYQGKKVANLVGTDIDISLFNKKVEIIAGSMMQFYLKFHDAADVYLNNFKVKSVISESGIEFKMNPSK